MSHEGRRALVLLAGLLVLGVLGGKACQACTPEPKPELVLKDPSCRDYVAVPGESCRGHRMLWVGRSGLVCSCILVPKRR